MIDVFTKEELDIFYDYVQDMLILFEEDSSFQNSTGNIIFEKNKFLLLKNKISDQLNCFL